ncbi:MAG: hypothetical protein WCX28_02560 [Bacteriovoracaceae bacterium]|nr:hypothetical protein [Bacteroidota bacterium]
MLLNGQRLFYFVALIATFSLVGCVDTPTNGPTPPNYRSSIKYFHAGRSVDTIAYPISKITYIKKDSILKTVLISGTDSIRTKITYDQTITVSRYRRYQVDFAQSYDLYVDGSFKKTMARGSTTSYYDIASGNRLFTLKGKGVRIDSITVVKIDSLVTTYRDSIKGNSVTARLVSDTTRDGRTVKFITVTPDTVKITIDSITTTIESERQYSMYFVGRKKALEQNESGLARFGNIEFANTQERLLFQPVGRTDSAIVKFVNAYPDMGKDTGVAIRTSSAGNNIIPRVKFGEGVSRVLKCKNDTTYKFFIQYDGKAVDSVSVTVSKTKTYSVVVLDSAGVRSTQKYTH